MVNLEMAEEEQKHATFVCPDCNRIWQLAEWLGDIVDSTHCAKCFTPGERVEFEDITEERKKEIREIIHDVFSFAYKEGFDIKVQNFGLQEDNKGLMIIYKNNYYEIDSELFKDWS